MGGRKQQNKVTFINILVPIFLSRPILFWNNLTLMHGEMGLSIRIVGYKRHVNSSLGLKLHYHTEKRFPVRRASQRGVDVKHNQAGGLELSSSLSQETSKLSSFTCLLSLWLLNSHLQFSSDSIRDEESSQYFSCTY